MLQLFNPFALKGGHLAIGLAFEIFMLSELSEYEVTRCRSQKENGTLAKDK